MGGVDAISLLSLEMPIPSALILPRGGMTDKRFRPFGFAQDDMGLSRIDHFLCEDRNPCQ